MYVIDTTDYDQSDKKILKNRPIFENVAKTAAKICKIQLES